MCNVLHDCVLSRLCVTRFTQIFIEHTIVMDSTVPNKAKMPELDCWLNCESRCFGDKGDVEDITEG